MERFGIESSKDYYINNKTHSKEIKTKSNSRKILFVCKTNMFISPIAEAIFNDKSNDGALSAGLANPVFNKPSLSTVKLCQNHGLDISEHWIREIDDIEINGVGLILTSTCSIRDTLKIRFPFLEIFTIKEYSGGYSNLDFEDPKNGTPDDGEKCFNEIFEAVSKISVKKIKLVEKTDPVKNFQYLDDLIHSGRNEIILDFDIILDEIEESQYLSGVKLDVNDLTIDGCGHTIDANGKSRIFECCAKNIILKNVTLKNGFCNDAGGAICNFGELTILDSILKNNSSKEFGGAIKNTGDLAIEKSTIDNNVANCGGAIHNEEGMLSIEDSTLDNNLSEGGGAIYNRNGELIIRSSTFNANNSNGMSGGAIDNVGSALNIIESSFKDNRGGNGGAINNYNGDVVIVKSLIKDNSVGGDGGAINNTFDSTLTIKDSIICNNSANGNYGGGGAINNRAKLSLINSSLNNNTTQKNGGAIYNFSDGNVKLADVELGNDIYNEGRIFIDGKFSSICEKAIINKGYAIAGSIDIAGKIDNEHKMCELKFLENDKKDFSYLNDLIQSGTDEIMLENDIILNISDNEDSLFGNGIKINRDDLVIDGNGHTIDAQFFARIFECSGRNIVIKNIVLKNGFTMDDAGAILNTGELSIEDSIFSDNVSNGGNGGAIKSFDGKLLIKESVFNDNIAEFGGAIYNIRTSLTIIKSKLNQNTSNAVFGNDGGGAIYSNEAEVRIEESTVINNMSNKGGGAIYAESSKLDIIKSTFCQNSVNRSSRTRDNGGAIWSSGGLNIVESTLNQNAAGDGGAIFSPDGDVTIKDSTMSQNSAGGDGGAINNGNGNLTITGSTLDQNTSDANYYQDGGGAIYTNDVLVIKNSKLRLNVAKDNGGAIYNTARHFEMIDCEISGNASPKNIIYTTDSLQVYNTDFCNNHSTDIIFNEGKETNLGIFYVKFIENENKNSVIFNNGKSCTIENSIFENNLSCTHSNNIKNQSRLKLINPQIRDDGKSILNEGHILVRDPTQDLLDKIHGNGIVETVEIPHDEMPDFENLDKKIHICKDYEDDFVKITFDGQNKVVKLKMDFRIETYETEFYEGGIELDVDNLIIDGNDKIIDGAESSRIFIITGNDITLKNITFKNGHSHKFYDTSSNHGGAIKNNHNNKLTICDCKFIRNISEDAGGAIHNYKGKLTISNSMFCQNAARDGGAIDNNGDLTIYDSTFNESKTEGGNGGAINNKATLSIHKSEFNQNISDNGGAINNNEGILDIDESTFSKNNVNKFGNGGAINSEKGELTIRNSTFSENASLRFGSGGAINDKNAISTIIKSAFNKNISNASGEGGAINKGGGVLNIRESTFEQNIADNGGAINNHGKLTIIGCLFNKNTISSYGDGGAIKNIGELTVTDSTLINNRAASNGGAIYNHGKLKVSGSSINQNKTISGGGIYNRDTMTIIGSILKNNVASGSFNGVGGGAITNDNGFLTISDSTISDNRAKRGGAVYSWYSKNKLDNCTLENNKPDDIYEEPEE